jgi:integrase
MPKIAKELGPLDVKRLTSPGYHAVGKVAGLMLQVTKTGARSWVLRTMVGAKRREIGLGAYPAVGLALAHQKAQATRDAIINGVDPVAARAARRELLAQQQREQHAMLWTFRRCAEEYIRSMAPGWRSAKHAKQWPSTLEKYVFPIIGELPVSDIGIDQVLAIVKPHWLTKNETINRVRSRVELVLDWATAMKYRQGENPARWKGNLDKLLARRSTVAPVKNHRALDETALPGFMTKLRQIVGTSARCLEFVILTAARSGEARLATWNEIDWTTGTWHIPGSRMKSGRPHRVPLSPQALQILSALDRFDDEAFIFPGRVTGRPLSDMSLSAVMRRMGVDAVPHGFRASFSSWCAASTNYPADVREMALAHAIGNETEAAYQRSDLFGKRRHLMTDWASFLSTTSKPPKPKPSLVKRTTRPTTK